MNSNKIFTVLGARRSGTNYLESLLLMNFPNEVANLNKDLKEKIFSPDRRPWLFNECGSKHETVNFKVFKNNYLALAVIREPISWLDARLRFHAKVFGDSATGKLQNPEWIRELIEKEYNRFYRKVIEFNILTLRYDDLLSKLDSTLLLVGQEFKLNCPEKFLDEANIIGPAGIIISKRADDFKAEKINFSDHQLSVYQECFDKNLY